MIEKVLTIGVYGTNESKFFHALKSNNVDLLCDIRLHRGMRGSTFSYVNSRYLQDKLSELGIKYIHVKELAPSKEVRAKQKHEDAISGDVKRTRIALGSSFIEAYENNNLHLFDFEGFIRSFPPEVKTIALFCVERSPEACHRSLVGQLIRQRYGIPVKDITP